jgi:hypothetical protein
MENKPRVAQNWYDPQLLGAPREGPGDQKRGERLGKAASRHTVQRLGTQSRGARSLSDFLTPLEETGTKLTMSGEDVPLPGPRRSRSCP